ncbi:hypothetical protein HK405_000160, partial [Cladochytrium tenue]
MITLFPKVVASSSTPRRAWPEAGAASSPCPATLDEARDRLRAAAPDGTPQVLLLADCFLPVPALTTAVDVLVSHGGHCADRPRRRHPDRRLRTEQQINLDHVVAASTATRGGTDPCELSDVLGDKFSEALAQIGWGRYDEGFVTAEALGAEGHPGMRALMDLVLSTLHNPAAAAALGSSAGQSLSSSRMRIEGWFRHASASWSGVRDNVSKSAGPDLPDTCKWAGPPEETVRLRAQAAEWRVKLFAELISWSANPLTGYCGVGRQRVARTTAGVVGPDLDVGRRLTCLPPRRPPPALRHATPQPWSPPQETR